MRILLLIVVLLAFGIVFGVGSALVGHNATAWDPASLKIGSAAVEVVTPEILPETGEPIAEIDNLVHDFGVMDASESGSHDFVITNSGAAMLELAPGGTTCKCTLSRISSGKVLAGESATITVAWAGKNNAGEFRHTATVFTNDMHKPSVVLTVQGRMTGTFRASPQELTLGRITAGDSATGNVRLFSYLDKPFSVSDVKVSDPEHLEVSIEPLPEEDVKREQDAKSGKLVKVAIKPGLPLGQFNETITLDTDIEGIDSFEIIVQGTIGSEVSIVGPGWIKERNLLYLGGVDPAVGRSRALLLRVGGVNRRETNFKVGSVVPDVLKVKLEEPTESSDGRLTVRKLIISVPKGSRPAVHMGPGREDFGCVTIQTDAPEAPELKVYVKFAVGG